ncbi:hypothetical protein Rs2_01423 [Raphanus sativus]|uniref:Uncharacterized protein LOC108812708 n=1 Tax=Raphanus sativus TaxID=3726 RepID=A0A6J0JXY8_RAPSA|nr:uncharacterized protein LOC108812708 [Raphanus sativus]KAJ4915873.1 hypothetical protein Rs2_01423 [Raphanus sativus]
MAKEKLKPLPTSDGGEIADTTPREKKHKKKNRKRSEPDPDVPSTTREPRHSGVDEERDGGVVEDAHNEPTMGDKFESLHLLEGEKLRSEEESNRVDDKKPPTAASVNVLLRQALHADDRSLLLDCLYNRDEQVIANSVAKLNSAEVLKLLNSLLPILQSRGAVLACAIPWIKCVLLTHSSGIMSQNSSLIALNSMYQLIESRVSTLHTAVEVSSGLDLLVDDLDEEEEDEGPVIYEDKDTDDEEGQGPDEAMETDEDGDESADEAADGVNAFEDFDDMSD